MEMISFRAGRTSALTFCKGCPQALNSSLSQSTGCEMPRSVNEWKVLLIFQFLCIFYFNTSDALLSKCKRESEGCQCHPSYSRYNGKSQSGSNVTDSCLKLFTEKLDWNSAYLSCEKEYSFILQREVHSYLYEALKSQGINLIWIGIKRVNGFYINLGSTEPSFFKETGLKKEWSLKNPIFDCVALNLSNGVLVTLDCSRKLKFVCQNNGLPVYPVEETLACPVDWSFFYQLPISRKKCIWAFKSNSLAEAEQSCLANGGEIADIRDYFALHTYKSELKSTVRSVSSTPQPFYFQFGAPNFWDKSRSDPIRNLTKSCATHILLSVLGSTVKQNQNLDCSDKLFICEQDAKSISIYTRVTPQVSEAFPSTDYTNDQLTCEVLLDGRPLNETKDQVQYQWFKNGIPISETNRLFKLGFYWDPTKFFHLKTNRQGAYRCGARVVGLLEMHLSQEVDYFYSDISSYIFTVHDDSRQLLNYDFSQLGFGEYKANLKTSMAEFKKDLKILPNILWDFQNFSINGNVSLTKMLLYIKRNESLYVKLNNETKVHQLLQKHITDRKFNPGLWSGKSLTLRSADVCFFEVVPSSKTSYEGDLTWPNTLQTKMAESEPMCLNVWKLVTRECKASTAVGAVWQPFNYSLCTKYQMALKDLEVKCPEGFHILDANLCYTINTEGHSYDEANEICQINSGYMMNLRMFMNHFYSALDVSKRFWISEKVASPNVMSSIFHLPLSLSNVSLSKSSFHCASVSSSFTSDLTLMESCQKENSFVCIYQPLKVLTLKKLTYSWSRLSIQKACYYFQNDKKATWKEAKGVCRSFGASLLQSIRGPGDYALFKVFIHSYVQSENRGKSWWMNLIQDKNSLKWMTSPSEEVQFVDWNTHTDYSRQTSAGVLAFDAHSNGVRWNLENPRDQTGFICEMEDCTDSHPTLAYIDDQTNRKIKLNNYIAVLQNLNLTCVPNGWFVADSISWFKDGIPISPNSDKLLMFVEPTAKLEDILPYQGYYWCSVGQYQPFAKIYSSKVLFRLPGLHTFVLYMHSPDLFADVSDCSDYMKNFMLPPTFVDHLNKTIDGFEIAVLRNVTCERSTIHYYIHIHVREDEKGEEQVLKSVESSVSSSIEVMSTFLDDFQIDKNNLSLRSSVACQSEKVLINRYLTWPTTLIGQRVQSEEICVGGKGNVIERECLGDFNTGAFWDSVKEECVDEFSSSTLNLFNLSRRRITENNVLNTSLNLEMLTSNSEELSFKDVQYVAEILSNIGKVSEIKPKTFTSVVSTMDIVIGIGRNLKNESRYSTTNVSSKILFAWGDILSNLDTNRGSYKAAGSNIVVLVVPIQDNSTWFPVGGVLERWSFNQTTLFNGTDKKSYDEISDYEAKILLPETLVATTGVGDNLKICIHKNFHNVTKVEVVSPIIDVIVGSKSAYNLDPPVEMVFKVPEKGKSDLYDCAYWNQHLNKDFGGWSYKGCISEFLDSSHVRCSCDHLTSFAVILTMTPDFEVPEWDQTILAGITYIGCAFSIFGLGIIILTFVLFRQWRKNVKHKALFNLSLALFCFLVIFVVGVERKVSNRACIAVAALLHFFMLASFAWMLVEAFMQYLSLVKVIGTYIPRFMQKAMLFGWGVPVIIVGITLSYNHKLYDSKTQYCWLSNKIFYYAVAGPVLAMLLMNFVIFALILYSNTCGRPHKYLRTNQNEKQENVTRAKAVFCVSVLLGLSWIFGFLAVDKATLVFQYLFAITTTLQGFFIFVFFVFRQKKTRDLWLGLFTPTPTPEISHISHNTGTTDVNSRGGVNNGQSGWSKAVYRVRKSYVSFKG